MTMKRNQTRREIQTKSRSCMYDEMKRACDYNASSKSPIYMGGTDQTSGFRCKRDSRSPCGQNSITVMIGDNE